eukprot:gene1579-4365_t
MSQRQLLRGKGSQWQMQGMLVRWTAGAGIGTILGRDARSYVITAPVLRRSNVVSTVTDESLIGKGNGKQGKRRDVMVDEAISEPGCVWGFTYNEVRGTDRMPEIDNIGKVIATDITMQQWLSITGTAGEVIKGGPRSGGGDDRPVARTSRSVHRQPLVFRRQGDDDMPEAEMIAGGGRARSRDRSRGQRGGSPAARPPPKVKGMAMDDSSESPGKSAGSDQPQRSAAEQRQFEEMKGFLEGISLGGWADPLNADGWDSMDDLRLIKEEDFPDTMPRGHIRRIQSALAKL